MPLDYLARIAQTPAPTFQEGQRAELIAELWRELGYPCEIDAVGNVLTRISPPGTEGHPALLLASHLDTVFEAGTDVTVREDGGRLIGPGVGDNSASLAVLTALLRDLRGQTGLLRRPLWLAANVGEEGLGDLRGSKHLISQHRPALGAFIAVDGYLGIAVTRGVGVRRYRATFLGPGGHSWGDQAPSTLHALGRAISALYALPLPPTPRTTLNVGLASGGTSVNSIAASAELLLDLRSLDPDVLGRLDRRAVSALHAAAREAGVSVRIEQVGDRPGGDLHSAGLLPPIREAAREIKTELRTASSSTDANAAAPHGLPAVAIGVYRGGNAHRLDEWVQLSSLAPGLKFLRRVVELYQQQPVA
ncbi:M20/M25/M40 family metallo-hydrolase [Deinococcus radiopugnans]|uniref:Di/tripeptidase n=1 Tax=Deinococcus radiopugnans ATCC 19172 TaxID=585398 RepID=A0A5C4Y9R5_9DEIO|nr:M20/M25/M40 family metallo-hydrolase [Deinococcus radiopugnans]MBB6015932.1 di/tripeptidase [Deinococcus radiopugnans ATCC 19172]TNM72374.1 M20/M25/M40 family metallo-hydrolase [Deinococcus radiopugnans ATCC 19172]